MAHVIDCSQHDTTLNHERLTRFTLSAPKRIGEVETLQK